MTAIHKFLWLHSRRYRFWHVRRTVRKVARSVQHFNRVVQQNSR